MKAFSRFMIFMMCIAFLASGCANMSNKQKCFVKGAAAGAVIGGVGGGIVGNENDDNNVEEGAAIGAVAGGIVGGIIGALMCKDPTPPPPPPKTEPTPPPPPRKPEPPRAEKPKERIVLRGINFDFDKYVIKPEFRPILDEAANALKSRPNIVEVMIEGHTDSIGTDAYNQKLSEKRAEAVKKYLISKGIAPIQLKTVGFGESKPIAPNKLANGKDNPEGRSMNRRVEFEVIQK
jgi:outer membrane protein OmpA-like peptidoglycan-associated protein